MPRIFVGGSTQLTTFALASDWLKSLDVSYFLFIGITFFLMQFRSRHFMRQINLKLTKKIIFLQAFPDRPLTQTFVAALIAGNCVAITMQPLDVIATRLYNQGEIAHSET